LKLFYRNGSDLKHFTTIVLNVGCKFHQDKERKVVTRNFEFMVEIEFRVEKLCGPLKTASWPTTGPWPIGWKPPR